MCSHHSGPGLTKLADLTADWAATGAALQYEYLWADGVKYKKPVRLSAPEYVDKLFDWVEAQVRPCVPAACTLVGSTDSQMPSARQHRVQCLWLHKRHQINQQQGPKACFRTIRTAGC